MYEVALGCLAISHTDDQIFITIHTKAGVIE
jgi:hypothetical protein